MRERDIQLTASEFKAVAREALEAGTRCASLARDWLKQRTEEMAQRQGERAPGARPSSGRAGQSGARGWQEDAASTSGGERRANSTRAPWNESDREVRDGARGGNGAGLGGSSETQDPAQASSPGDEGYGVAYAQDARAEFDDRLPYGLSDRDYAGIERQQGQPGFAGDVRGHQGFAHAGGYRPADGGSDRLAGDIGYGNGSGAARKSGISPGPGVAQSGFRGRGPRGYVRSDERIKEDLSEQLADSDAIDASDITVQVSQGVVTLTGTVQHRRMKHLAEDLAEHCSGVKDVDNQIRVKREDAGTSPTPDPGTGSSPTGTTPGAGSTAELGPSLGASSPFGSDSADAAGNATQAGTGAGEQDTPPDLTRNP